MDWRLYHRIWDSLSVKLVYINPWFRLGNYLPYHWNVSIYASARFLLFHELHLLILKIRTNYVCIACCWYWCFFNCRFWHCYNSNNCRFQRVHFYEGIKTSNMAALTTLQCRLSVIMQLQLWPLVMTGIWKKMENIGNTTIYDIIYSFINETANILSV